MNVQCEEVPQVMTPTVNLLTELLIFYLFFIFFKTDFFPHEFIYLFMAALGLRCCAWAFCSCCKRGIFFVAVHKLLIVVASLVAEHRL